VKKYVHGSEECKDQSCESKVVIPQSSVCGKQLEVSIVKESLIKIWHVAYCWKDKKIEISKWKNVMRLALS